MKAFTVRLIAFLLAVPCVIANASPLQPAQADFIKKGLQYFDAARGLQYWGEDNGGWRVAIKRVSPALAYLSDGGLGETVPINVTVFSKDTDWETLSDLREMTFTLTITADGLAPVYLTRQLSQTSYSGNDNGSCWAFDTKFSMHELATLWGKLPASINLVVSLTSVRKAPVSSSKPSIELKPSLTETATLSQRLASFRPGQSKTEVLRSMGLAERILMPKSKDNRSDYFQYEFPNPFAPVNLPAPNRKVWLFFDKDDKYVRHYLTMFGC